ncbi:tRNA (adenosine(37)-N6)-dimethylallyltransferase MiaA [Candidatus Adlerbacteria bacterium RIFCSPHIGHO2_02_FULL_54_18]|uniref:tRNA dimethylallyltransferase n=1 Tax=Candidatus Adlerbacteria bacterium RIFCSPHIGHO2_02_FULL_54_18 TaxID=1797241 RepID=A0A1F4Y1M0_9BACT|nr:MAG: tRNA (adenosine(37)-N6)-dimethylallyltransferase MiaA [Candidatus Adlerbacteria bacterium RIFCSPHIGHO2_02_FULL_54_18]
MLKQKIIAIVGPTASGKSSLGVFLAQKLNGEIISADSRQVYKGLNIGTGKVTKKEMGGIKHHLLDVSSPKKQFTVDNFVRLATKVQDRIVKNGALPIVVGGTGLYVDMFLGRMSYPNVPPNEKLRKQLEHRTTEQLFVQLQKLDPRRAANIEPDHKRRIIRAIEIAKAIGQSPKISRSDASGEYEVLWLGLSPTPEKLKKNIRIRLFARIRAGMIREAEKLHKAGLSYKRMEELGLEYRYLSALLQKRLTQKEFETELERAIWQYAKRQKRWFRRNKEIVWVSGKAEALRLSKKFLGGR